MALLRREGLNSASRSTFASGLLRSAIAEREEYSSNWATYWEM